MNTKKFETQFENENGNRISEETDFSYPQSCSSNCTKGPDPGDFLNENRGIRSQNLYESAVLQTPVHKKTKNMNERFYATYARHDELEKDVHNALNRQHSAGCSGSMGIHENRCASARGNPVPLPQNYSNQNQNMTYSFVLTPDFQHFTREFPDSNHQILCENQSQIPREDSRDSVQFATVLRRPITTFSANAENTGINAKIWPYCSLAHGYNMPISGPSKNLRILENPEFKSRFLNGKANGISNGTGRFPAECMQSTTQMPSDVFTGSATPAECLSRNSSYDNSCSDSGRDLQKTTNCPNRLISSVKEVEIDNV